MFFKNMFRNMQQPQQSAPVMGAPGSPFAMPQQNMMMQGGQISPIPQQQPMPPMQHPVMMMSGGQVSQAPQQIQSMLNQQGGMPFPSRWGER